MCLKKIAVSEGKSSLVCWIVGSHRQCRRITGILSLQNLHYQRHLSTHSSADLLGCCARSQDIRGGAIVHAESIKHGFDSDTSFANIVINFYAKCGSLAQALIAFRSLPDKDTVSWNSLISGYAKQGRGEAAFESFRQMKRMRFNPDNYTFGSLLGFCSANAATEETRELHCHIFKSGFQQHEAVACSLIDAYGKCSRPEDARQVFDNMPRRNVVVWTAMIAGYALSGRAHEAMDLFGKMVETSDLHEINEYIFTSVLNAFCADEALQHGKQVQVQAIKRGLEQEVLCKIPTLQKSSACSGECRIQD